MLDSIRAVIIHLLPLFKHFYELRPALFVFIAILEVQSKLHLGRRLWPILIKSTW